MKKINKQQYLDIIRKTVSTFKYIDDATNTYKPIELYPFQEDIIYEIITKTHRFNHCLVCTRGGKSFVVALGVLISMIVHPFEDWLIIAPTKDKADIIMNYIRKFISSNPSIESMLNFKTAKASDKILSEKSKDAVVLWHKQGVYSRVSVLSADVKNKQADGSSLMGSGSATIIVDESAEIPDTIYSKILRMTTQTKNPFLMELGNPWFRNHFYNSSKDSNEEESENFNHMFFDDEELLRQGRFTEDGLKLNKLSPDYDILYRCLFPDADSINSDGFIPLFTETFIKDHLVESMPFLIGEKYIGVDVSYAGADSNVWCIKGGNAISILEENKSSKSEDVVAKTLQLSRDYGVPTRNITIDSTAGGNVYLGLFRNLGYNNIRGLNFAEKSDRNPEKYSNKKSEGFWKLYQFLSNGGKLVGTYEKWRQLCYIKYKADGTGKVQIIGKQAIRKEHKRSPDTADAAMIATFFSETNSNAASYEATKKKVFFNRKKAKRFK